MPSSKFSSIETAAEGSKQLQPSLQEIEQWQTCSDRLISDFYSGLATLPTYREITPDQMAEFETQTQACSDFPDLLKLVFKHMTRSGILTSGPGHMAFVPGGGLYSGAVSDHIAAAINAFSADSFASPIAVKIHEDVIQFFCSMVGYDKHSWGDVTSGGSHATLTAFWTARESRSIRAKDYERTVAYLSEQTHHCCEKSLRILFGSDLIIRKVPLSEHGMSSAALCSLIEQDRASGLIPFLVVATAGTTNLGRIDPLDEIANIAEKQGLWLHIDAAYGGFFLLCEELKPKFSGISRADSIVLDPHKGMFLPYGCGAVLIKNGHLLKQHKEHEGAYLQDREDTEQKSPMDYSLELTRPFRSLRIWLSLKQYGPAVFAEALREKYLLAEHCRAELLKVPGIRVFGSIDLSIFAFSIESEGGDQSKSNRLTQLLLDSLNKTPDFFLSSTLIDGAFLIRVAILSFRTHIETVESLIRSVGVETQTLVKAGEL